MRKPEGISDEAKAAVTEGDFWSLFFTEEILEQIVDCTNQKIDEECQKMGYSEDRMKKSPYIAPTDKVNVLINTRACSTRLRLEKQTALLIGTNFKTYKSCFPHQDLGLILHISLLANLGPIS